VILLNLHMSFRLEFRNNDPFENADIRNGDNEVGLGYLVLFIGLSALPALNGLKWERADCFETLAATYKITVS